MKHMYTTARRGVFVIGLLGLATLAGLAKARPVIVVEQNGLPSMMLSEKDAAMRDALQTLPEVLAAIAEREGEFPPEVENGLQLFGGLINRPSRLAVVHNPEYVNGGGFGYGLVLSMDMGAGPAGRESAEGMHQILSGAFAESELGAQIAASTDFAGFQEAWLPLVRMSFGHRETPQGWRYDLALGAIGDLDTPFTTHEWQTPQGDAPAALRVFIDPAGLDQAFIMGRGLLAASAPDAAPQIAGLFRFLNDSGVIGQDAINAELQLVPGAQSTRMHLQVSNASKLRDLLRQSPKGLDAGVLDLIPVDAVTAAATQFNPEVIEAVLDILETNQIPVRAALADIEAQIGLSISEQLLPSLGDTFALYTATGTGGKGLASSVFLMEVKDENTFGGVMDYFTEMANNVLMFEADGQMTVSAWSHQGQVYHSVHGVGLPIPAEPTWAIVDGWLVAALTPQAARVAVEQVQKRGPSIANSMAFQRAGLTKDAFAFTYVNPEKTMADGYPFLAAAGAAADGMFGLTGKDVAAGANGIPERRWLLPTYRELANDARPALLRARWEGDVLQYSADVDGSVWALAGMLLGTGSTLESLLQGIGMGQGAAQQPEPWGDSWDQDFEMEWDEDAWDDDQMDDGMNGG